MLGPKSSSVVVSFQLLLNHFTHRYGISSDPSVKSFEMELCSYQSRNNGTVH